MSPVNSCASVFYHPGGQESRLSWTHRALFFRPKKKKRQNRPDKKREKLSTKAQVHAHVILLLLRFLALVLAWPTRSATWLAPMVGPKASRCIQLRSAGPPLKKRAENTKKQQKTGAGRTQGETATQVFFHVFSHGLVWFCHLANHEAHAPGVSERPKRACFGDGAR